MKVLRSGRALVVALAIVSGCAVDVPRLMIQDADLQARVMDTVATDSTLAARMVDRLLADEGTRQALVDRTLENSESARLVMLEIARDRTRLDGVLSLAVQDSAMKQHVLALFQGMQMAGTR